MYFTEVRELAAGGDLSRYGRFAPCVSPQTLWEEYLYRQMIQELPVLESISDNTRLTNSPRSSMSLRGTWRSLAQDPRSDTMLICLPKSKEELSVRFALDLAILAVSIFTMKMRYWFKEKTRKRTTGTLSGQRK